MKSHSLSPVKAVELSDNKKIGYCSAIYKTLKSCPEDCPFMGAGCYGELGHVGIITRRLTASRFHSPEGIARVEAAAIMSLTGRFDLRLDVVGDTRTDEAARIVSRAVLDYKDASRMYRHDGREADVWKYTHAWKAVRRSSWQGVSILASVETDEQVCDAHSRGYATAMVVAKFAKPSVYVTEGGTTILPCPFHTRGTQCVDCRICMKDDRLLANEITIGFQAHGAMAGEVRKTLRSLEVVA